ncbi:hypothetical protein Scep_007241 [Stephania cephalantha]|uniref:Uncharacterized protein n=1 Tax=Stephania cephalantha TaxID=152367 RepID=A0AAP0KB67_9MAGN
MEGVVKNKSKSSRKRKEAINSNSAEQNKDEQSTSTDCKSTKRVASKSDAMAVVWAYEVVIGLSELYASNREEYVEGALTIFKWIAHGIPNYNVVNAIFDSNKNVGIDSNSENGFEDIPKKKHKENESLLENLECKVNCTQVDFKAMKCDFNAFKCDIGKEIKTMYEKRDLLLKQTSCDTNGNGSCTAKEKTTSNEEVDPKKDVLDEVTQADSQDYTPHVMKFAQENEIEGEFLENLLDCIPHWFGIVKGKRKRKKVASCLEPFVEPTSQRKKLREKEDSYDPDEERPHDDLMKFKCWFSSKDDAIVDLNYCIGDRTWFRILWTKNNWLDNKGKAGRTDEAVKIFEQMKTIGKYDEDDACFWLLSLLGEKNGWRYGKDDGEKNNLEGNWLLLSEGQK